MKELSLNILDITENSTKAGAKLVTVTLISKNGILTLEIADDGTGMTPEILARVTDPFYTTRTTRKVGLGLPFLKLAAEQTGGSVGIVSRFIGEYPESHGTTVTAVFDTSHIDSPPLGDVISTVVTMVQGHPDCDFVYTHTSETLSVKLDTREIREALGGDVPLCEPEVLGWIAENLREQYGISENSHGTVFL